MRRPIVCGLLLLGTLVPLGSPAQVAKVAGVAAPSVAPRQRDLTKYTPQQRNFYLTGQRGLEWLQRANKPDGRFVHGLVPALRVPLEGDGYLRQAGAAFALARA